MPQVENPRSARVSSAATAGRASNIPTEDGVCRGETPQRNARRLRLPSATPSGNSMALKDSVVLRYFAAALALSIVPGGWLLLGGRALWSFRKRWEKN
jgi:hypothetical protein